ncbi:MAG: formylglycine-generating enzyme family protein, partial [Anaerolineae bacterium]|nr:formylglycine-generating enzyme family protein [Anaerolineae bacterium]
MLILRAPRCAAILSLFLLLGAAQPSLAQEAPVTANADWSPVVETFDGVPMALAPPGCFIMGQADDAPNEQPMHEICFSAAFWIDLNEVSHDQFAQFGAVAGRPAAFDAIGGDLPRERVTWFEARDLCSLRGARLPSEAEWEYAARGGSPAEDVFGAGQANCKGCGSPWDGKRIAPVGRFPPNAFGLYDMLGNVWEWTNDFFDPVAATVQQQSHGVARTIRGGSFVSTVSGWSRGYRSSMPAGHKSRYTGFRVARTIAPAAHPDPGPDWFRPYQQPPAGFETATGALTPLLAPSETAQSWAQKRNTLRSKWRAILGAPAIAPPTPNARHIETYSDRGLQGQILELQTEPDSWEKILILRPANAARAPLPVVIVPYYDVDVPAARNLGGRTFMPGSVRAYAYLAAQRGYLAIAIRWFGESYGE